MTLLNRRAARYNHAAMRWVVTLLLAVAGPLGAAQFRAGAAVADITPVNWPVPMTGQFNQRLADKAWDPLSARALVLDDGAGAIAIVLVDSCYVPRAVFDDAKRRVQRVTGIPAHRMLMAATHTHTAPPAKDSFLDKADPGYLERLTRGIVEAVSKAWERRAPAEIGWGRTEVPEHVFNRRWHMKPGGIAVNPFGGTEDMVRMNPPRASPLLETPAGPTDPEVVFLSVRSPGGEPMALLANYSLHYVGGVPEGGVSADYFGEFARRIRERLGGGGSFVGILSNGTSANINNINFREPSEKREPFEQIRRVAGRVADAVAEAYKGVQHKGSVTLAMAQRELRVELRRPTSEQIAQAQEFLAEPDDQKLPRHAREYARRTLALAKRSPREDLPLQALRIGDIGIAAIPCEVFVEIGLEIKRSSPLKPSFTIELANGHWNYLPTPEQHRLGGYETWMGTNVVEERASEKITQVILELMEEVNKQ